MGFRYELQPADGDDAGSFETSASDWKVGDTLIADGNRHYVVTAVLLPERLAEFVDGVENGSSRSSFSDVASSGKMTGVAPGSALHEHLRHTWHP